MTFCIFPAVGSQVTGHEYDTHRSVALEYLLDTSRDRRPPPLAMVFGEGDSNARWMECKILLFSLSTSPHFSPLTLLASLSLSLSLSLSPFSLQLNWYPLTKTLPESKSALSLSCVISQTKSVSHFWTNSHSLMRSLSTPGGGKYQLKHVHLSEHTHTLTVTIKQKSLHTSQQKRVSERNRQTEREREREREREISVSFFSFF